MINLFRKPVIAFSALVLLAAVGLAAKPGPTNHWYRIGKAAHAHVRKQSVKARNQYCSRTCRRAGARKAGDLGACKEGCVFG